MSDAPVRPGGLFSWRHRITARSRLTLVYSGMLVGTGAIMLAIIYAFMRFVPSYQVVGIPTLIAAVKDGATPGTSADSMVSTVAPTAGALADTGSLTAKTTASAITLYSSTDILNTLLVTSLVTLVVLAVVGAWIGWIVAGRVLRPLQRINDAAQLAGSGDLSQRVGLDGPEDEFTRLSATFDSMLSRLERSFQAHQRFAANASHELRTPLATSKAMLDVTLADEAAGAGELRRMALRLRETNDRSIETVESLLDLASTENAPIALSEVHLDDAVTSALAEIEDEADARGITVTAEIRAVPVQGDAILLRRLAANLLFNATRHNVDGGTILVETSSDGDGGGRLVVENTGAVIPESTLEILAEPFVRGVGRTAGPGPRGHGLGLTLVDSIVGAHGGRLALEARPGGGLRAAVTLPPHPIAAGD